MSLTGTLWSWKPSIQVIYPAQFSKLGGGGSKVYPKPTDRSCGNPGQMIKFSILRENNTTPCPTPCQAYRQGSEWMTTEAGTQELHFFPVRREMQTSKRGLRIRLAGSTSPGSLFLALLTPSLSCHHSFDILAAIKEQKTSPSKSWHATCLVLNKPIDLPLLIY